MRKEGDEQLFIRRVSFGAMSGLQATACQCNCKCKCQCGCPGVASSNNSTANSTANDAGSSANGCQTTCCKGP